MKIKVLYKREITDSNKRLIATFDQFDNLLSELIKKNLQEDTIAIINK